MEQDFDNHWGVRSQRAVMEYIRLVRAGGFRPSAKHQSLDPGQVAVCEARDRAEVQQCRPRERFEEVFHHLDRVSTKDLNEQLLRYERYLADLPKDFKDPSFVKFRSNYHDKRKLVDSPLVQQRRFLENAIQEMKAELSSRGGQEPTPSPVDAIASGIQQRIELEARLLRECEEAVEKHPDQEETIRSGYHRAIDALREGE